jgi:hypothetical protein
MEAALQGQPSMLEVQRMRRADNHSVQPRMRDKLLGALGCQAERELLLDLLKFARAETADRGQLDVVALGEQRHVIGGGPPACADEAEAGFLGSHGFLLVYSRHAGWPRTRLTWTELLIWSSTIAGGPEFLVTQSPNARDANSDGWHPGRPGLARARVRQHYF